MRRRRVKITGIGPVTPAGLGVEQFWKSLQENRSRVRVFRKLDPELGPFVASYIDRFDIGNFCDSASLPKGAARHTQFALAAAKMAIDDANLAISDLKRINCAVVAGSSLMDFEGISKTIEGVGSRGVKGAITRTVYSTNAAVISASIGQSFGFPTRSIAVQTSCCAGLDAIGVATRMVSQGEVDLAICGGTEAPLFRTPLVELRATGLTPATAELADRLNRPFDLWRTTGVVGEGAAMLVLEPENSPRPGYCTIAGYSSCNDLGDDICGGLYFAIKQAIADAGISIGDVESISAWGPGHSVVDAAEAKVLHQVFADRISEIPAVSIKGLIGNPLGAAPAIQVAAAAMAIREGVIPPTVNWEFPDPACRLNLSSAPRCIQHAVTLVNAHGLSGVNSSLLLVK